MKIIHQIFLDIGLRPYSERDDYQHYVDINKSINPDWEHILWTDDKVEKFVLTLSQDIQDMWNDFPTKFYKIDFVRYLILSVYGGVYIDLDVNCKIPLDNMGDSIVGAWYNPKTSKWESNNNVIMLSPELYPKLIKYSMDQYYLKKEMKVYKTWKVRRFLQTVGARMYKRFVKLEKIQKNTKPFNECFDDDESPPLPSWLMIQV